MLIQEAGVSSRSLRRIFTPSSFSKKMFYYPTRVGHYFCSRQYHFHYRSGIAIQTGHRMNYMVFLIKKGQMEIRVDNEHSTLSSRDIVIFDCQEMYEYRAITDDLEFYWLLFNGGQSDLFYENILQIHKGHAFPVADIAQLTLLFTRILTYGEMTNHVPEHIYSELIYTVLCQLLLVETSNTDNLESLIQKSIVYMNQNFEKPLTIQKVSSHVGLSASYFSNQFRLKTGYPPYEYLTLQRIHRAKELLISTNLTIKQIGFEIGFQSEDNFIRSFQKKVGVSPNTFRQFPI